MTALRRKAIIAGWAMLAMLLAGCGQDGKARAVVERFMETGMLLDDYDIVRWAKVGTAHFVSDSALQAMHAHAVTLKQVKADVPYVPRTEKLNFVQVKYATGRDTVRQTFYLDEHLTGVVGFTNN